jgi:predicted kinase
MIAELDDVAGITTMSLFLISALGTFSLIAHELSYIAGDIADDAVAETLKFPVAVNVMNSADKLNPNTVMIISVTATTLRKIVVIFSILTGFLTYREDKPKTSLFSQFCFVSACIFCYSSIEWVRDLEGMKHIMATLTICRGLPGSGKSTHALKQVVRNPDTTVRVNRDDLRFMMHGKYVLNDPGLEKALTTNEHDIVRNSLLRKKNVISDNTNLSSRAVKGLIDVAAEFDGKVQVRFQDFPVSVKECIERDNKRKAAGERFVGEGVITEMAKRYHIGKDGALPELPASAYEMIVRPTFVHQDESLPTAWLVDVDGTIADISHRDPFDWSNIEDDEPIMPVVNLVKDLKNAGHRIILVSGREDYVLERTKVWLDVWEIPYDEFFMRASGDMRPDNKIKNEIVTNHIMPRYNIVGCLDDRRQVVTEYRKMGLLVAQVANGMF